MKRIIFLRKFFIFSAFFVGVFLIYSPVRAAITIQGPIMDGTYAPVISTGGGAIIPLAQFMLSQSSGADKLTKVGITFVADGALANTEVSRISLWKESGTNPGFQIGEDTFVGGAAQTSITVG